MEKTRNTVIDLFKKLGFAISKLVNDGEVDDVELTGELAKDPIAALNYASAMAKSIEEPVKARARTRTRKVTAPEHEVSSPKHTVKSKQETVSPTIKVEENDGREI